MPETWFCILALILITYVILDGRNFGAGALLPLVARTFPERRQVVTAIGPLWTWHEVWLVVFGGTLLSAFPKLLASAFAGYYLALFMVLWLLILRGIAMEVGGHLASPLWQTFWNFILAASSTLLAFFLGVALGNTARGVPLDASGEFHMALFTHFGVRGYVGLLDWYTLSTGMWTLVLLGAHGACHLAAQTEGLLGERSQKAARFLWPLAGLFTVGVLIESAVVRPDLFLVAAHRPLAWVGLLAGLAAALVLFLNLAKNRARPAARASHFLIAALLYTSVAAVFPILLHSTLDPQNSLDIYNSAADAHALALALYWWPPAFILTWVYAWFIARAYRAGSGKPY